MIKKNIVVSILDSNNETVLSVKSIDSKADVMLELTTAKVKVHARELTEAVTVVLDYMKDNCYNENDVIKTQNMPLIIEGD